MARPRNFDIEEVLQAAIEVFVAGGYAGAPISLLESRTGLASGSIYHTFGDKRGLYRAALGHYVDNGFEALAERHGLPSGGIPALLAFLRDVISTAGCGHRGCLLTNALVESAGIPDLAPTEIARGLEGLRNAFRSAISNAVPKHRLEVSTERLVTLYQGLCVRLRGPHDPDMLMLVVESELADLRR